MGGAVLTDTGSLAKLVRDYLAEGYDVSTLSDGDILKRVEGAFSVFKKGREWAREERPDPPEPLIRDHAFQESTSPNAKGECVKCGRIQTAHKDMGGTDVRTDR